MKTKKHLVLIFLTVLFNFSLFDVNAADDKNTIQNCDCVQYRAKAARESIRHFNPRPRRGDRIKVAVSDRCKPNGNGCKGDCAFRLKFKGQTVFVKIDCSNGTVSAVNKKDGKALNYFEGVEGTIVGETVSFE